MASQELKIDKIKQEGTTYAEYEIYPFDRGFGHTFSAPLRRILLSSIKGVSIVSLKIKGVDHEFSTMKGVKEDVLTFIVNLSKVVFQVEASESETVSLKVHGKKIVTASDIKVPGNVTVGNPEEYIAELTDDKSQLEVEIKIEAGYGFELAENEIRNSETGLIPVNKNFSPVNKVNVNVRQTRVGQKTDFEKIVMQIWTKGNVEPDEALKQASKIFTERLRDLDAVIHDFEGDLASERDKEEEYETSEEEEVK